MTDVTKDAKVGRLLTGILVSVMLLMMQVTGARPADAVCAKVKVTSPGEVYFIRGLASIFSLGLDAFGKEVSALGVENCISNHSAWQPVSNDIIERNHRDEISARIIIIGHSLGANIPPKMATTIGKANIPVAYVVMLDPVEPTVFGANVEEIFNYYLPKRKDNTLHAGRGFAGVLKNVNVKQFGGFDHFNIDENVALRNIMKQRIVELVNTRAEAEK